MREYEVTVILKTDLDEESRDQLIERVTVWLTPDEDETNKPTIHHWGHRTLAYAIKKNKEGYYVHYEARLEPQRVNQIERDMLYEDDILRHLFVRKDS